MMALGDKRFAVVNGNRHDVCFVAATDARDDNRFTWIQYLIRKSHSSPTDLSSILRKPLSCYHIVYVLTGLPL